MIVGVGGQGTLISSKIIGNVALKKSYDVKVSEVHGMAQRGGSVATCVKLGPKIYSPIIEKGEADVIIAFEQLEALRWAEFLTENGIIIVNEEIIPPMPVISGKENYPQNICEWLKKNYKNVFFINASHIAKKCGNIKTTNMVLLGAAAYLADIAGPGEDEIWRQAICEAFSENFAKMNVKAFEEGKRKALEFKKDGNANFL